MNISKGQGLDITKAAKDAGAELKVLVAGAGWDPANEGTDIDLDLLTVFLGEDGKAIPDENGNGTNADEAVCAFFNKDPKGAHHAGDNLTGEGDGDDEQIEITLANVPSNVKEIAVVVASYSGQTFGDVKNAFIRMVNKDGDKELAKYELSGDYGSTRGVELGRVSRQGDSWAFTATGKSIDGNFRQIVESYGVNGLNG